MQQAQVKQVSASKQLQAQMLAKLKSVYPRALSYTDLFEDRLNGVCATDKKNKTGGTYLRALVKQGLVKQITVGYYCYIPQ